ncbi:LysM peptidoglycan-binding domain-containing protein [Clostridium estertheticum]|uniref:LysM peptidoglycan-binding domain-containing protein n=1 Tax=Clostridium estertheticum TaxID=238834 RepID=UPI0013E99AB0|nr:LysM peptidoglycan-binding domain-containing protein [Clostridium estertheticum]MBZ9688309.1 LysM peptidoglycan-binding domain-containing protein [Clostridium estertheticum]
MLIHVVNARETLWQIANNYRVSMTAIINVNELPNPNQLVIGQALLIPSEDVFHTVKPGESLWKIAQTYGTTVQIILQNNQFVNPSNIFPGLLIYIPASRHRIQSGETLWAIAQIYGVSLQNLIKVNNIIDTNLVYPGTILVIPHKQRPPMSVNAYIYDLGEDAVPIIKKDGEHLTYLSPFAYLIKEDGSLQAINDIPAIQAAKAERAIPMMSITNFTATSKGENLANIILNSPTIVESLLADIIKTMKEKGYMGINIDFENVIPADREAYNNFLKRAVNSLHSEGFFISTALAPKVSGSQTGTLYEAHDYEAHGRICDFVILMTYEWGWRKGPPQAISPLNQIKRVLNYAITVIPSGKTYFGFQIYARDWLLPHIEGQEAETFSCQEAILRAVRYGAVIQYDTVAQSPFYRYTDEQLRAHEVWFEDARSAQAKFDVVKSYNLKGISYWVLGYPFPQNWALLEDNFTIKKENSIQKF